MNTGELGEPAAHELAQRLEVALVPEVLLGVGHVVRRLRILLLGLLLGRLDDAAEAGPDGIDDDQVGEGKPGRFVLDETCRHGGQRAVGREVHPLWPHGTHVQVRRGGSRAAVEDERHRAAAIVTARDVRDGEDFRGGLLLLAKHCPLRRRGVLDRLSPTAPGRSRLGPGGRLVVELCVVLVVLRLVAHGRARYRQPCTM
jgi:hypothetical protein